MKDTGHDVSFTCFSCVLFWQTMGLLSFMCERVSWRVFHVSLHERRVFDTHERHTNTNDTHERHVFHVCHLYFWQTMGLLSFMCVSWRVFHVSLHERRVRRVHDTQETWKTRAFVFHFCLMTCLSGVFTWKTCLSCVSWHLSHETYVYIISMYTRQMNQRRVFHVCHGICIDESISDERHRYTRPIRQNPCL